MNLAATSHQTNSVIVTAVVLCAFVFSACQQDTQATSDITSDVTDLGPEDVGVDSYDTSDTTDTRDARDAADLPPLDCTCPVEGATCERIDGKAVCMIDGEMCDFDVYGPDCRPDCSDHSDCGQKQYCNVNFRCFPRRECRYTHIKCPPGYWCDPDLGIPGTCRRSGGTPSGRVCEKDWECKSGSCSEGTCDQRCFAQEDCPNSYQECSNFDDVANSLVCWIPDAGVEICDVSCPEDQLCAHDECVPHACYRTEHCPEGDCIISPESGTGGPKSVGLCATEEQLCNGWEFRVTKDDPFCRLPIDCEEWRHPCPEGYECVKDETRFGLREHGVGTSWCSRRVEPGEWPPG